MKNVLTKSTAASASYTVPRSTQRWPGSRSLSSLKRQRQRMTALASSAWSTAPEISTFGINLLHKQWLGHKAVLDSDPGQWPGHHCGQWQPVLVTAKHCSRPMAAVVRSYRGSARALLRYRNQVYKCLLFLSFRCHSHSRTSECPTWKAC